MKRSFAISLIVILAIVLAGTVAQWNLFNHAVRSLDGRSARLTISAIGPILDRGHRVKDDLIIQEVIQNLARAPGLAWSCVVDESGIILAHSEPLQIGRTLEKSKLKSGSFRLWSHTLRDAERPWGTLLLAVSRRSENKQRQQQALLLLAINVFVALGLSWIYRWGVRRGLDHTKELASVEFQRRELENELARVNRNHTVAESLWTSMVAQALDKMPLPALVLDNAQRLAGCNRQACDELGVADMAKLRGKSWQDIPLLAGCGEPLEKSLLHQGTTVEARSHEGLLQFVSHATGESTATWVVWKELAEV
jgi:PAS domain-containing protein